MAVELSTLKPGRGAKKTKRRVGRGNASGAGTYSGRGQKGQRSRSGGAGGLKLKGMKARLQNVPKLRGFKSGKPKPATVSLTDIDKHFVAGATVSPQQLKKQGLVDIIPTTGVKILASGKLTKKVTVSGCKLSAAAKAAIENAGGTVTE